MHAERDDLAGPVRDVLDIAVLERRVSYLVGPKILEYAWAAEQSALELTVKVIVKGNACLTD